MRKKFLNQEGQSLIEALIALAVAILVLLALVGITIASINNATFSRNQSLATKYAKQVMEEIRNHREAVADSWGDFVSDCEGGSSITISDPPNLSFVPPVITCSCADDRCDIEVEVNWTDAKGLHGSKLNTILTNW